jgi:hypothetical protein
MKQKTKAKICSITASHRVSRSKERAHVASERDRESRKRRPKCPKSKPAIESVGSMREREAGREEGGRQAGGAERWKDH